MASITASPAITARIPWRRALRWAFTAILAAGISGFVVGGILGRGAMRILAVTSPPIAQGRLTDDAARVGQFTLSGSFGLAVAVGMGSALLVAPAYLLARRILPRSRWGRVGGMALATGAVGGALLVHDHPSFDYTILQPTWLAVAFFVAVPAGVGALTAFLTELLAPAPGPRLPGRLAHVWRGRAVTVVGTTVYWLIVAWGLYNIGADVLSLATDRASSAPWTL